MNRPSFRPEAWETTKPQDEATGPAQKRELSALTLEDLPSDLRQRLVRESEEFLNSLSLEEAELLHEVEDPACASVRDVEAWLREDARDRGE